MTSSHKPTNNYAFDSIRSPVGGGTTACFFETISPFSHGSIRDTQVSAPLPSDAPFDLRSIRSALRYTIPQLQKRGLFLASKWACEQLVGMQSDTTEDVDEGEGDDLKTNDSAKRKTTRTNKYHEDEEGAFISSSERDAVLFASTLVATGDYQRSAFYLRKYAANAYSSSSSSSSSSSCASSSSSSSPSSSSSSSSSSPVPFYMKSKVGLFIGTYSLYMAGEKLREQEAAEGGGSSGFRGEEGTHRTDGRGKTEGKAETATEIGIFAGGHSQSRNPYLLDLYNELSPIYFKYMLFESSASSSSTSLSTSTGSMDGFLFFIFAIVVRDLRKQGCGNAGIPIELMDMTAECESPGALKVPSSRELLLESVRRCPANWSAWLQLVDECAGSNSSPQQNAPTWLDVVGVENENGDGDDKEMQRRSILGSMYLCFLVHLNLELQQGTTALGILQGQAPHSTKGVAITNVFPSSQVTGTSTALAYYCLRDYDRAQHCFETMRDADPHRLEHVDTYSNILYVKERRAELSHLAHTVFKGEKYAPESCCVVGNYYSLKGQHERAIVYFQRALRLNRHCLSAWTLMGHEFVELRNTAAAVQCYRKAVDVSERDYRAWYGLGQTYEMLHLYQYALYYYKKAASLKPQDARMWGAVGNCLSRLGNRREAMVALERAVNSGDKEGIATRELARLYREAGQSAAAADCYHRHLKMLGIGSDDGHYLVDAERAEGLIFLASFHRSQGDLVHAEEYCMRLADFVGTEGDEARAMMREIRALQEARAPGAAQTVTMSP